MEFRTKIELQRIQPAIGHDEKIMMLGSCFTENIGERLTRGMFDVDINPFGTLYNPASIAKSIDRLLEGREFSKEELFEYQGTWHSFAHHSRFSSSNPDTALERINERFHKAADNLRRARHLIVTFGTAFVFSLEENGEIVANCHKLPAARFRRTRLSVDEIVEEWTALLHRLLEVNPDLCLTFTVSPIRHLADGAHGNQLSKSTLLLAVDRLTEAIPQCRYFPSYEIQLDELRDYRFYAADMTHPSEVAIDYIYSRFSEACFSDSAQQAATDCEKLYRQMHHRPLTDNAEAITRFKASTEKLRQQLLDRYPYLNI